MDSLRALDDVLNASANDGDATDPPPAIGRDERRMIVRAYNHWVTTLRGRDYPSVEELEPAKLGDFGPHGVLLDFTASAEDPGIAFIGDALRAECGLADDIRDVGQVPRRSLLSRLTDHYLQIIANRAPIGFEAEFVSMRGVPTLYRGLLMPFSSDGASIDFIYGVINWKELADAATQTDLAAQLGAALAEPARVPRTPLWPNGPHAKLADAPALATVDGIDVTDDFVLLLARREKDGRLSVIAADGDPSSLGRAIRAAARGL